MSTPFPPFSAAARGSHWRSLEREKWDVLVIGGGITGAGIARDAAGRGFRVALVESGDVGQGTSSRSSRLVHGGLRYLQNGHLGLVFEASAERRRLLRLARHLVHPQEFLFPVFHGDPVGYRMLQAGMWLYDALSLFRNIRPHRMLPRAAAEREEPRLRRDGLVGAALYHDATVDDARLTLANARGAHEAGAAVVPRAEVVGFRRDGAALVTRVRDLLSGDEREVRARVVVNAAGPWSDVVRTLADPAARPRLRPTKGVHLVFRAERVGNRHAITFPSPVDGRVMFVLPWGDLTYVGTTDTDLPTWPAPVEVEAEDVAYLLASANGIFPGARLAEDDVVSSWAGVRPLLSAEGASAGATSREHEIWRDPSGLLNVGGGKLTTYRVMAAQVTDAAVRILREAHRRIGGDSLTRDLPLPGAPRGDWEGFEAGIRAEAIAAGLSDATGAHLARAHGEDAEVLLAQVREDPSLAEPLVAGRPYVRAEVRHAVQDEMALRLEDVMARRTQLFYETEDGGLSSAWKIAGWMAGEPGVGWDAAEVERQVAAYAESVAATRGFGR